MMAECGSVTDPGWCHQAGQWLRRRLVTTSNTVSRHQVRTLLSLLNTHLRQGRTPLQRTAREARTGSEKERLGARLMIDYGRTTGYLPQQEEEEEEGLLQVVATCRPDDGRCFPWFPASLYLMTGGDLDLTTSLLGLLPAGHLLLQQPGRLSQLAGLGHCVEWLVAEEVPAVAAVLDQQQVPASLLTSGWLQQCWINTLDWTEIVNYLLVSLIMGQDYVAYFTVAVIRHVQESVVNNNNNVYEDIISKQIRGFKTGDYLPFMDKLCQRHCKYIRKYI